MIANTANPVIIDGDTGRIDPHALYPQALRRPPALRTPLPVYRAYRAARSVQLSGVGLLRRIAADPYWVLVALKRVAQLGAVALVAWVGWEIYLAVVAVGEWFNYYGRSIIAVAVCVVLLGLLGGGTAVAKCAGLHCGGCKG
jgi:hypothetical protein